MEHIHKVVEIKNTITFENAIAYFLIMDCPVNPDKIVLVNHDIPILDVGSEFDPHFSNTGVIARFQPSMDGWSLCCDMGARF